MFKVYTFAELENKPKLRDAMYRLRYQIFVERLKLELDCPKGIEIDQFDREGTEYLLSHSENYDEVVASCRLIPSTMPNLLGEVFPFLSTNPVPVNDQIWEASRLAVDHNRAVENMNISNAAGRLMCGIMEYALDLGLSHLMSVLDVRLERIIRQTGWAPKRLGLAHKIDGMKVCGAFAEISEQALQSVREKTGVLETQIEPSEKVLANIENGYLELAERHSPLVELAQ